MFSSAASMLRWGSGRLGGVQRAVQSSVDNRPSVARFSTWRTHRGLNRRKHQRTDHPLLTSCVVSSSEKKKKKKVKTQKVFVKNPAVIIMKTFSQNLLLFFRQVRFFGSNNNENFFTKLTAFFSPSPIFSCTRDSTHGELIGV
jgi:hypothetical protein